jgi:hypothetical protein
MVLAATISPQTSDPLHQFYLLLNAPLPGGVFVEASVVRNDNGETLERCIDGQTSVRLEQVTAVATNSPCDNKTHPIAPERLALGSVHGDV